MGFLEVSWRCAYWASLLSIFTYNSLVQASNVVHLTVDWKEAPPGMVQNELLRRLKARSYIQEGMYDNRSTVAYGAYMANVTIGTPGQSLSLVIETGWSDTIVLAATEYECNQKSWPNGDGPCFGGTFDETKSSTFQTTISNGLDSEQRDGNPDGNTVRFVGDYFTDSFEIGGAQLKDLQMGLALNSSNSTLYYGILGLGSSAYEAEIVSNQTPYPNFMDQLVSQSLISTKAYSFSLNDLNSNTGSIVFGGIDTRKFSGTLGVLQSTNDFVDMSQIAILDSQGTTFVLMNSTEAAETNLTTSFETSNPLSYFPETVLDNVISYFRAVDDRNNSGLVFVDCEKLTTEAGAIFEFTFGRSVGPTINVPISEMVLPLNYLLGPEAISLVKTSFTNTCMLGMTSLNQSVPGYIYTLGNTFLRSAYAVFDLDHNQTALAQSVYGVTDSNIVELSASATGIPALSGVAVSSTSTSTTTSASGSNPGAGTPGSNSKSGGISSGAIAGIVIGILIVLGAIGFLAFICFRRRRAARRVPQEPILEIDELPTNSNTHELPGKNHEFEKNESKSNTHEVLENTSEVEKNELPTQDNKHELAEAGVGIRTTDLPRELEDPAQHPVEAPSATYSPVYGELDSYGAISPDQFEIASVPELPAEPMQRKPLPPQSPISRISGTSILDPMLPGLSGSDTGRASGPDARSMGNGPSKVDILQERLERVRAEKERLAKMRELEEMEAVLQQEIMTELKKEHGSEGRLS